MRSVLLILTALALTGSPAHGDSGPGDTARGRALAKQVCATCHRVDKGQKTPKLSPVKAFQEVADNPARTALSLRVFLRTPHRNMPNLLLTQAETDNVIAYILSLK